MDFVYVCIVLSAMSLGGTIAIPTDLQEALDQYFRPLVSELTTRIEQLEQLHKEDLETIADMKRDIDGLKSENDHLKDKVTFLHRLLTKRRHSVKENLDINEAVLGVTMNHSRLVNTDGEKNRNSEQRLTGDTEDEHTDPETRISRNRRIVPSNNAVAFYAYLGHNLIDPGNEHEIAFDNIVTQVGGHYYSRNTGTFTCLTAGIYVFHWTVQTANSDMLMYVNLVKNGQIVGYGNSYHASSGSGTAIVQLEIGDEVWVRVAQHSTGVDIQEHLSMFSGFLLQ